MAGTPDTVLTNLRPELGTPRWEFDLAMDRRGFIADAILPVIEAEKRSGNLGLMPVESLLQTEDLRRAPRSGYVRGSWEFEDDSFKTVEYGYEEAVDDNDAEAYSEYFNSEMVASMRAQDKLWRAREVRVANAIFNATTFASYTSAVSTEWSDTTATPITDVKDARSSVSSNAGFYPNVLIISQTVYDNLKLNAQVLDAIQSQGAGDRTLQRDIDQQKMAMAFNMDMVLVGGGRKNTAEAGQTAVFADIWDDEYAMVAKIGTSGDLMDPALGHTIHWGGDGSRIQGTPESYRDDTVRADIIRVRHQIQDRIWDAKFGYLLSNITA